MNLPVVLDIAIGLIFIYLIASLLASEIQELVSTVLQWRAKHLRESIQNLLAGGQGTSRDDQLGDFLETIYNDPLIRNMNQSSRGLIGALGKWLYRNIFYRGQGIFGQATTAPSYISPETFATALLERVGMAALIDQLTQIRLEKFVGRIIGQYDVYEQGQDRLISVPDDAFFQDKDYREKGSIRVLAEKAKSLSHDVELGTTARTILNLHTNADFIALVEEYDDILRDFQSNEADLDTCVDRIKEGLDVYINQLNSLSVINEVSVNAANSSLTNESVRNEVRGDDTSIDAASANSMTEANGTTIQALLSDVQQQQLELEKQQLNYFKKRLVALKTGTFGERKERAIAAGKLKPSLLEIAEVFDRASSTYQEIEGAYKDIAAAYETGILSQRIKLYLQAVNEYIALLRKEKQSGTNPSTKIPVRSLTIADLTEASYQSTIATLTQHLSPQERQIYKDWQTYQQSFTAIIRAIATSLQAAGKLTNRNTQVTQPVAEINFKVLYPSVTASLKQLEQSDRFNLDREVLTQLNSTDQQVYKGWQIYQQIILNVVRDLAHRLQDEERLFDSQTKTEFQQYPSELDDADLYQSVKYSLNLMSNEERQLRINAAAIKLASEQRKTYFKYQGYEQIQDLLADVPPSVKQSLAILARRAQTKVEYAKNQLEQFNYEVSRWFDRSMNRASGVYKRNAKGVALIIGFLIALLSNTDTFHVVGRLAGDDDLRSIITARVGSITQNIKSEDIYSRQQLRDLKQNTDQILQEISLPIRWTPENLAQQFNCRATNVSSPISLAPIAKSTSDNSAQELWKSFYRECLNETNPPGQFDLFRVVNVAARPASWVDTARIFAGWLISGIAIAMGAPFWFDLLSKVMNVRNTGAKPASVPDKDTTKTGG